MNLQSEVIKHQYEKFNLLVPLTDFLARLSFYSKEAIEDALNDLRHNHEDIVAVNELIAAIEKYRKAIS